MAVAGRSSLPSRPDPAGTARLAPSTTPRILILCDFFTEGHGGTPESVLLLALELARQGVAADVFCNKGLLQDAHLRQALPPGNDGESFSARRPHPAAYEALFVAGSWNRRAPLLALKAACRGVPVTYAAKGCLCRIEFERLRDMRRIPYLVLVEWLLLVLARRIVFSSRAEQDAFVLPRRLWIKKVSCLPEPFRSGPITEPPPGENRIVSLGFLAEISPRKGLLELINGLGHYLSLRPDARLRMRIAGSARKGSEAYFEHCRALARQNGSNAHIEWCEPVRGVQRSEFYRSLDVFICPSRFESFGLTPLEALWQGVAVCAAPAMGVLEHLDPEAPVLRLAGLGREEVARAIGELVDSIEGWRARGRAWRERPALARGNSQIAGEFARVLLKRS